ncbi:MAG: nucleoside hydrolase [Acidobacteriota bacterium]|nr:MAG: nucleoside hydrolase [Acidobacteriota bacterium]
MRAFLHLLVLSLATVTTIGAPQKVIIDTDFGIPPQDDALAVLLALKAPQLEIVGFTTVMGNWSLEQATVDLLRVLEITENEQIPVYVGANMPLVHRKSDFAVQSYGEWYSDAPPKMPPGGFATTKARDDSASDFLIRAVKANPGEITIIALGPLTNLAIALRQDPAFAAAVKRLVIMGGAIASLPDGAGNLTPNAEFNFWVDPEAADIVLRSGIEMELSPLNVSRKTRFTRQHFEELTRPDTAISRLLRETMGPIYANSDRTYFMYDQVAVASVIDPTLVTTEEMIVSVDTQPGVGYGTSVGGRQPWPGSDGAGQIRVQYDLEWDRFIRMFIDSLNR